jgi:hypothetical protein
MYSVYSGCTMYTVRVLYAAQFIKKNTTDRLNENKSPKSLGMLNLYKVLQVFRVTFCYIT